MAQITERRGERSGKWSLVVLPISQTPTAKPWESGARNVSGCVEPRTVRHKTGNYGGNGGNGGYPEAAVVNSYQMPT